MKPKQKTLLYDIETTPNVSLTWGKYEQDVIKFVKEWELLCFGAKWLGKPTFIKGRDEYTEKDLVFELWKLLDEADIVIAHNGVRFDNRKANAKFIEFGLTPPSPYKVVDTKQVAKRYFAFNSNKLDDLGELLKVGRKVKHQGIELWEGCINNDQKSWAIMKKYNKQDVDLLERIYLKLRPWMTNHPILDHGFNCPNCSSNELQKRGFSINKRFTFQRFQCSSCGAWTQQKIK